MLDTTLVETSTSHLLKDGVVILEDSLFDEAKANIIIEQLRPYFDKLNFGDVTGSSLISSCQYVEFPLAVSSELIDCILDERVIAIASRYLNYEVRLTSSRVQRRLCGGVMEPHRDYGNSIVVLHYLTDPKPKQGATSFYLGSHTCSSVSREAGSEDAVYMRESNELRRYSRTSMAGYKTGSVAIYSSKTIHEIPKFKDPGRVVIISIFSPLCDARKFYYRHILTSDCLNLISESQRKVLGLSDTQRTSPEVKIRPFRLTLDYDPSYRYTFARRCFWILRFFKFKMRALLKL